MLIGASLKVLLMVVCYKRGSASSKVSHWTGSLLLVLISHLIRCHDKPSGLRFWRWTCEMTSPQHLWPSCAPQLATSSGRTPIQSVPSWSGQSPSVVATDFLTLSPKLLPELQRSDCVLVVPSRPWTCSDTGWSAWREESSQPNIEDCHRTRRSNTVGYGIDSTPSD